MRGFVLLLLLFMTLPWTAAAAPSIAFWDPYRGVPPSVTQETLELLQRFVQSFAFRIPNPLYRGTKDAADYFPGFVPALVSAYRVPNPLYLGIRAKKDYHPPVVPPPLSAKVVVRPSPITDTSGHGTPCGGADSDPYWANDCSCRCSKGGQHTLSYAVSDRCPEDDNRTCEDCRAITRHDRLVTTVAECLEPFNADHGF